MPRERYGRRHQSGKSSRLSETPSLSNTRSSETVELQPDLRIAVRESPHIPLHASPWPVDAR